MNERRTNWQQSIRRFQAEAGDVTELYVIRPDLSLEAFASSPRIRRLVDAANKFMDAMGKPELWPENSKPKCINCDTRLTLRECGAIILQMPFSRNWEREKARCVVAGACLECSTKSDQDICDCFARRWGAYTVPATPH